MSHFPQEIITVVGRCAAPLPARPAVGAPGGGLPGWSPADRAIPESTGGACLLDYPPPLTLVLILPPSPRPPSRREGGAQGYFMQGAPPLASPGAEPGRHGKRGANHTPGRGACLSCRLPTLTLVCFFAPIPPPALAERSSPPGKGEPKVISCKGLRPLHPRGLNPGGTGKEGRTIRPAEGLAFLVACQP